MRILILGGDGFCGWPTSLHLSACGHDVAIVDNLARRKADVELEADSLTPITPIGTRLEAWRELTGREIPYYNFNVAENYRVMLDLLNDWQPEAIVHFAEQRAAPYSMKSPGTSATRSTTTSTPPTTSCARWWRPSSTRTSCTWGRWGCTATERPA